MCTTARATCWTSIVGSSAGAPPGWSALMRGVVPGASAPAAPPTSIESESAVAAFPTSSCVHAIPCARPSSAVARVRPVIACLDAVYGLRTRQRGVGSCLCRGRAQAQRARNVRGERAIVDDAACAKIRYTYMGRQRSERRTALRCLPLERLHGFAREEEGAGEVRVNDGAEGRERDILDRHLGRGNAGVLGYRA
jgi:hypothetical protein